MKKILKQTILSPIAGKLRTEWLIRQTDQPLVHVFYHTISDTYLPHIHPIYTPKNRKAFKEDLDFLLNCFQPVSADEVLLHVTGEKEIRKPSFHLSFDDGLAEVYTVAAPVLISKGVPATIFVNSAFVDNKDLFFRYKEALIADCFMRREVHPEIQQAFATIFQKLPFKKGDLRTNLFQITYLQRSVLDEMAGLLSLDFNEFLQQHQPYLNSEQLIDLQSKGFCIGGHSIDHPRFSLLERKEQIRQTIVSCDFVQQQFNQSHRYFAFPFVDEGVDPAFFSDIYSSIDLTFGISGIQTEHNGRHLHRIDMEVPLKMNARQRINQAYAIHWIKNRLHPVGNPDSQ